jgi:hypothetical protein
MHCGGPVNVKLSLSFFFFLVLSGGQTENVKLVQWQKFVKKNASTNQTELL